ncbi:MAG: hypothetical protein Q9202_006917 [Teloschistes flavicans]
MAVDEKTRSGLRIIPPSELYAGIQNEEARTPAELEEEDDDEEAQAVNGRDGAQFEIVDQKGEVLLRTNRNIVDDARSQTMTMEEIEMLKAEGKGSGKDLIAKILDSHSALDQKTAFALAKYTLRKTKKYHRRFTVYPMDVPLLADWMLNDKEVSKIMEIREETLALVGSWSNVHFTPSQPGDDLDPIGQGRWLMVDDTGGLLVASAAEKLGILHMPEQPQSPAAFHEHESTHSEPQREESPPSPHPHPANHRPKPSSLATSNTITLLHSSSQPNLSLLHYFSFDAATPSPSHPLFSHLHTLSWLQLLDPSQDNSCQEPAIVPPETLQTWKSGKRGNYHRKRRRWERTRAIVDDTQAGGFDGLVVACFMKLDPVLAHLVPLLRGGAPVVVYSPSIEPLVELADLYSTARRVAYLNEAQKEGNEDFPVDPTLLLTPTVQTVRARPWQVLPGRTHPMMVGRGGAEGYVFTATRVLPAEGGVEARGITKKRKGKTGEGAVLHGGSGGRKENGK